jgi:hypothetical protein
MAHLRWSMDVPAASALTRKQLGWHPAQLGLIPDLHGMPLVEGLRGCYWPQDHAQKGPTSACAKGQTLACGPPPDRYYQKSEWLDS